MMSHTVYIVHCVDTEGPLYESLDATFDRIKEWFKVEIEPTRLNLKKLQNKEISLDGKERGIANMLRNDQLKYNDTWDKMYQMFEVLNSEDFRTNVPDSYGGGYYINWFVLDHVDYVRNPRRRTMGYCAVFEEYKRMFSEYKTKDALYLHYHPLSFSKEAHRTGTNISFSNTLNEIIARRIIKYNWFPAAFRPTHSEHMDLNIWLEQWIPFDFANSNKGKDEKLESEVEAGRFPYRFIDWRGAPTDWQIYNPSVWDARKEGELKRYIARCLNTGGRHSLVDESELEKAFKRAAAGEDVLLSVFNHDFRDMVSEINEFRRLVKTVAKKYENVKFKWSNAVEAFRTVLKLPKTKPPKLKIKFNENSLIVESDREIWGPQPFFAVKTIEGNYYHDNMIMLEQNKWAYVFDEDSLPLDAVSRIGLATNDSYGNTTILTTEPNNLDKHNITYLNID